MAFTRLTGGCKRQLSVGPQAEDLVREVGAGDLAQEPEALEDERQAVADEAARGRDLEVEVWRGRVAAVAEPAQHLATANAVSDVNPDRARLHVRIDHVSVRRDAQRDVIAREVGERRRRWIVRRRLIREFVAGDYHLSSSRGDQGLAVAEVAGQTVGVSDPGPVLLIEHHPINGEALRNDLVAVHDEQAPTMMCVVVAATLARPPDAAAHGRTQLQRLSASQRDVTDQTRESNRFIARWGAGGAHDAVLEGVGQVRLPSHSHVEPDDRRTRSAEQRRGARRLPRRRPADGIHPRGQCTPGKREQHSVGSGVANLDLLDVDGERRRAGQHELIGDVEASVGAPHGARAREHPRREPSEVSAGSPPHRRLGRPRSSPRPGSIALPPRSAR